MARVAARFLPSARAPGRWIATSSAGTSLRAISHSALYNARFYGIINFLLNLTVGSSCSLCSYYEVGRSEFGYVVSSSFAAVSMEMPSCDVKPKQYEVMW